MTDENLERMIDYVGRDRVLSMAAAHGWTDAKPPPKWIWMQIVTTLMERK